jgi:hypothetical protein
LPDRLRAAPAFALQTDGLELAVGAHDDPRLGRQWILVAPIRVLAEMSDPLGDDVQGRTADGEERGCN